MYVPALCDLADLTVLHLRGPVYFQEPPHASIVVLKTGSHRCSANYVAMAGCIKHEKPGHSISGFRSFHEVTTFYVLCLVFMGSGMSTSIWHSTFITGTGSSLNMKSRRYVFMCKREHLTWTSGPNKPPRKRQCQRKVCKTEISSLEAAIIQFYVCNPSPAHQLRDNTHGIGTKFNFPITFPSVLLTKGPDDCPRHSSQWLHILVS